MTIKERYSGIIEWFSENMPDAASELHYNNPFELLVAVILSAQCTDKRVNMVTPALLESYPTAGDMAEATASDLFEFIRSVSYPRAKAEHLVAMARRLTDVYDRVVPSSMDELLTLQGVGRKTANVILSIVYDRPAMAVDTHVFRLAERIGLTRGSKSPLQTEQILMKHIPTAVVGRAHHWLILHGRYVCTARSPRCADCGISTWCRKFDTDQRKLQAKKD